MPDVLYLDDGDERPARRCLADALEKMKASPTADRLFRTLTGFGVSPTIKFAKLAETKAIHCDGMKGFHGPRGYTSWSSGQPHIVLNAYFLESDAEFRDRHLIPALCHELLGHGLGYGRAHRHRLVEAFHSHELNEWNARLIQWCVDFEINGGLGDREAWTYLRAPRAYLAELKLRSPAYALTYSSAEMENPIAALKARLDDGYARLSELEASLVRHRSWYRVITHFIECHGRDPDDFKALSAEMEANDLLLCDEIRRAKAANAAMSSAVINFCAGVESDTLLVLSRVGRQVLFQEMESEVEALTGHLRSLAAAAKRAAQTGDLGPDQTAVDHWRGQVTFADLKAMYESDPEHFPNACVAPTQKRALMPKRPVGQRQKIRA